MKYHENIQVAHVYVSEYHKRVSIEKFIPDGMMQPFSGNKLDLERGKSRVLFDNKIIAC